MPLKIVPQGFKRTQDLGGMIGSRVFPNTSTPSNVNFNVNLPSSIENGSQDWSLRIYSSNYASLISAIEKLIKDPYGCFEQTSATTYPMVMALSFLKALP